MIFFSRSVCNWMGKLFVLELDYEEFFTRANLYRVMLRAQELNLHIRKLLIMQNRWMLEKLIIQRLLLGSIILLCI